MDPRQMQDTLDGLHVPRKGQCSGLPVCCRSLEVLGEGGWPDRAPRRRWDRAVIRLVTPDIKLLTCASGTGHLEVTNQTINVSEYA